MQEKVLCSLDLVKPLSHVNTLSINLVQAFGTLRIADEAPFRVEYRMYLHVFTTVGNERKAAYGSAERTTFHQHTLTHSFSMFQRVSRADVFKILRGGRLENLPTKSGANLFRHLCSHMPPLRNISRTSEDSSACGENGFR